MTLPTIPGVVWPERPTDMEFHEPPDDGYDPECVRCLYERFEAAIPLALEAARREGAAEAVARMAQWRLATTPIEWSEPVNLPGRNQT